MLNTPFAKTVMLLAVAGVIAAAFVYKALQPRFGVPSESLRVRHPAGFSVVRPMTWNYTPVQFFDGDQSKDYALSFFESRSEGLPSEMVVTRMRNRPKDLPAEPASAKVDGRTTYRSEIKRQRYLDTIFWFEDGGYWYRVGVSVPHSESIDDVIPFIATVRTEKPAVVPPSQPVSTAPLR